MSTSETGVVVLCTTTQPNTIKQLFNNLKSQISEANLHFCKTGIEIHQTDQYQIVSINAELYANQFEKYVCKKEVKIGLNITNLSKILKNIDNKGTLTFFVLEETNKNKVFGIRLENDEKETTTYKITAIDLDDDDINSADLNQDYDIHIDMPSSNLQNIINKVRSVDDNNDNSRIRIRLNGNDLSFNVNGEKGEADHHIPVKRIRITESKEVPADDIACLYDKSQGSSEIIQLEIRTSKLHEFVKCASMSKTVSIYMRNQYIFYLKYNINGLGEMLLGITPVMET